MAASLAEDVLAKRDVLEAVLEKMDAAALCQIKAMCRAWCNPVRCELCNRLWVRLSRREGQPEPAAAGVDSITDLDVECLNEVGRPWEVVVAGRELPQLVCAQQKTTLIRRIYHKYHLYFINYCT